MSTLQFPNVGFMKIFETDEIIKIGSYTPNVNEQMKYIRILLYINGTLAGTEKIRIKIYGDNGYTSALYTSDYSSLSGITNISTRWRGWVRTDFARCHLSLNNTYYLGCEINSYTRNAMTLFIGALYDYPNPIYGNSSTAFNIQPISIQPFSYKAAV